MWEIAQKRSLYEKGNSYLLFVLIFFVILSIIMLLPRSVQMSDSLVSQVDPLLNSWIIAWDIHQLFSDPLHLFDANIFFPYTRTLAFSEHLIIESLVALPVILVSSNPILGYNVLQLLSFILCGFAVYLLVFYLTKNKMAALVAGVIFAFHPYRFRQIGHIQNLFTFWTPLCLLYLHKFIKKPSTKSMGLFTLFFILQALSCGYLGIFLTIVVILAVLYYLLFVPRENILPFLKKLVISGAMAALFIAPFLVPYFQVKREHDFSRSLESNIRFSANILGYAVIPRFNKNVFYWPLSQKNRAKINRTDEGKLRPIGWGLFPGIITLLLVLQALFLLAVYQNKCRINKIERAGPISRLEKVIDYLLLFFILVSGVILFMRGPVLSFAGMTLSMTSLTLPVFSIVFLFALKLILSKSTLADVEQGKRQPIIHIRFYLFLAVLMMILSFGPRLYYVTQDFGSGPYMILYKYGVLFKGIRVPERFGVLVMLALSVLAGFGMARLLDGVKGKTKIVLTCLVLGFLIYEFICIPFPYVKISRKPAEVYRWLATDKGNYGILEYPLETLQADKYYMYWSTFHWKKLANGSSGFNPPQINKLRRLAHESGPFPNQEFLQYLKAKAPVRYIILHLRDLSEESREKILSNCDSFPDELKLEKEFENKDYVFRVLYDER